jgi:hypothetical protein
MLDGLAPYLLKPEQVGGMLGVSVAWVRDHSTHKQPRLPVIRVGGLLRFTEVAPLPADYNGPRLGVADTTRAARDRRTGEDGR